MEKRIAELFQLFRALVAVGKYEDRLFGGLPGEHQVQRFGGRGQAGQREWPGVAARQAGDKLMESLLPDQRLKQIADSGVGHGFVRTRMLSRARARS